MKDRYEEIAWKVIVILSYASLFVYGIGLSWIIFEQIQFLRIDDPFNWNSIWLTLGSLMFIPCLVIFTLIKLVHNDD